LGANEFDGAVVEKDAAALGVVVVEGKKLWAAVLIPAGFWHEYISNNGALTLP